VRRPGAVALAAALLAGAVLAGCSALARPAGTRPAATAPAGQSAQPAASATPPVPQVADPWQPGSRLFGINVYWENNPADGDDVVRAKARRVLDYVVGLGANAVAVSFPFYTAGVRSNALVTGTPTPPPQRLGILLDEATRSRLATTVRPILDEKSIVKENPKAWRGTIAPTDRDAWFASYTALLLPYARAAQAGKATFFTVATELNSLGGDRRWPALVAALKADYTGELAYSANYDEFVLRGFSPPVERVGVDAYPPIQLPDDATVEQLAAAWNQFLNRKAAGPMPALLLSEVGIAAQNGAYQAPYRWGSGQVPLNLTVQERWYTAVCQVVRQRQLAGVYWWYVSFDADPADPAEPRDRMVFLHRPAEKAVKDCFAAR
jgi:hypothetical protein